MLTYMKQIHPEAIPAEEKERRTGKINQSMSLMYNDMATYLFEQKEYKDAIVLFQQAKSFNIKDIGILLNIGDCAIKLGSLEEASDWYQQANHLLGGQPAPDKELLKQVYSRRANWMYEKAKLLFNKQKYSDSLELINKALELHITKDKLYLKGTLLIQLKQPERAVEHYKDILRRDPKDFIALEFMNQFEGR